MLAIIIPFYKLTFFEATLQSLAHQSDKRFKVYIGDDASPEDCTTLLQKFEGQFDFIYHRFETNLGGISLTQQWERCIVLSEDEEWLMILGDDDILGDNVVEEFYKSKQGLDKERVNVFKLASVIINETGKPISKIYKHPSREKASNAYWKHYKGESRSSLSEYIFRRSCYNQYKFTNFPLAWHADDKAWLDFSQDGILFGCNEAIVQVRLSSENISGRNDNISLKRKARMLFLEDIIRYKWDYFTNPQRNVFLFDFGILIKENKEITFKRVFLVFYKFCFMGCFYDAFRFIRRIYWIK
ncbi:glycosyltransferase family 2 protein [Flavobacterium channae]|uniref:glycosyltransferase family 2 protein n=1 Tax=Flavobacterium channae TaxID=2897181 RepID=UPI001E647F99|nr:glycosyltransferase family A protein [Flavobacterium channae]UGS24201.1 glycosyltransferase family 2 protein [Flavobacterium channae]